MDEVCSAAEKHRSALVPSGLVDTMLGQLVHTTEACPELWLHFLELIASLNWRGKCFTRVVIRGVTANYLSYRASKLHSNTSFRASQLSFHHPPTHQRRSRYGFGILVDGSIQGDLDREWLGGMFVSVGVVGS
eukprot:COSAG02_NODE_20924_length_809_cov_2.121127_1_plen_133_part_00